MGVEEKLPTGVMLTTLEGASGFAALALAGLAFSSFQYLGGISADHVQERPLTVITLADLATPPPPPIPEKPVKVAEDVPHAASPIVVPTPIIVTPAPSPTLAVADAPAPPALAPAAAKATQVEASDPGPAAPRTAAATDGGDLSSKMVSAKPPSYPVESRRLREQGTVILSVLLALDGHVERLSIAKSSGFFRLDRAASGAVRNWRWSPTVRDGQPVLVQGNVVIPFVLRG